MVVDSESKKGEATQKIIAEKENTIQLLQKKLKIPASQLIQAFELTKIEKEKEILADESCYLLNKLVFK